MASTSSVPLIPSVFAAAVASVAKSTGLRPGECNCGEKHNDSHAAGVGEPGAGKRCSILHTTANVHRVYMPKKSPFRLKNRKNNCIPMIIALQLYFLPSNSTDSICVLNFSNTTNLSSQANPWG